VSRQRVLRERSSAKTGMTLQELADFVAHAQLDHYDPETQVKAEVRFGGGLRSVSVSDVQSPFDQARVTRPPDEYGNTSGETP
jgi:hypothetical protein